MNVDSFLDIEKRTGVKNSEIDDFIEKASAVEDAIKGLRDGSLDPSNMPKIKGIKTKEEEEEEERQRQIKLEELREKEAARKAKRKEEERERWWRGADFYSKNKHTDDDSIQVDDENEDSNGSGSKSTSVFQKTMDRYNNDYGRWDSWEPSDPTTLEERAELERLEEAKRNDEFERNNPEFCKSHMDDMKERNRKKAKKEESSNISRLKGNRFFKQKDYSTALTYYTDALKVLPYDLSTLMNIAQVKIKLNELEDAIEFLSRVLYLDENHVKALSRKAFVLSERGDYKNALVSVEKALAVDNTNKDLLVQVEDIRGVINSSEEADRVKKISTMVEKMDIENKPAPSTIAEVTKDMNMDEMMTATKFTLMNKLITRMQKNEFSLNKEEAKDMEIPIGGVNVFDACCEMAQDDDDLRVLARTSGVVTLCCKFFNENTASTDSDILALVGPCLKCISIISKNDKSSKTLLLELGTLENIKNCMTDPTMKIATLKSKQPSNIYSRLRFLTASMYVFLEVAFDTKIQKHFTLISDEFIQSLSIILEDISSHSSDVKKHEVVVEILAFYRIVSLFVKQITFDSKEKIKLSSTSGLMVPSLGIALKKICSSFSDVIKSESTRLKMEGSVILHSAIELVIEALLGCSQCESLRPAFVIPLFDDNDESTASSILEVSSKSEYKAFNAQPLCFGLLMNLCISSGDDTVKQMLASAGAADKCLSIIELGVFLLPEIRKRMEIEEGGVTLKGINVSGVELSRSVGLLSRLCTVPSVMEKIYQPATFRVLCRALARSVGIFSESGKTLNLSTDVGKAYEEKSWVIDEKNNLVRIISSSNNTPSEGCKKVASEEKLVVALLHLFPEPSYHGAEITPASVVIPPKKPAPALLLGNAARCLMPYADNEEYASVLYGRSAAVGIERLINAMATCNDIRVRKNIAILLAKGAKFPGVRERLTYYRGMQMIVELNSTGNL